MNADSNTRPLPHRVSLLHCGLGWDAQPEAELDLDMAVLALNADGQLAEGKAGFVYAGHPRHPSGAIQLLNDNITGEGEGDDEQLVVNLRTLPADITKLIFVVTLDCSEEQQQDLGQVKNAFWRLFERSTRKVFLHHGLSNGQWQGITTLFVATLERATDGWQLIPNIEPSPLQNLNQLLHHYL
ncbi:MAG: TerD family protein [Cyanobacteria bacterium J06642_11]